MRNQLTILMVLLLLCITTCLADDEVVLLTEMDGQVVVTADDAPFATLHYDEKWDKPFIQPIYSPEGIRVTRGYPLEKIEGESTDHIWHRGLWFAHGNINGIDFWREKSGGGKFPLPLGRIVTVNDIGNNKKINITSVPGSPKSVYFSCSLLPEDKLSIGTFRELFSFQRLNGNNVIDIQIIILGHLFRDLVFNDTEEGTLGLRLRDEFRQDRDATLLNSDGLKGTENIWGKRAKWVDYSAVIDGKTIGVAVFDHPNNPRFPTYWHARGYALFCANPFGIRDFTQDSSKNGRFTIKAGKGAIFRYRVVIHSGNAQDAAVDSMYRSYAGDNLLLDVKDIWLGSDRS